MIANKELSVPDATGPFKQRNELGESSFVVSMDDIEQGCPILAMEECESVDEGHGHLALDHVRSTWFADAGIAGDVEQIVDQLEREPDLETEGGHGIDEGCWGIGDVVATLDAILNGPAVFPSTIS